MSIEKLQDKIRKLKNPSVVDFGILPEQIPSYILEEEGSIPKAYGRFCKELLENLNALVPAVRFSLTGFSALGVEGYGLLAEITKKANELDYYIFLDVPGALSAQEATMLSGMLFDNMCSLSFDALITTTYIGSDSILPYIAQLPESGKALFTVLRTSNKTAPEVQDLLTGSRFVHMAVADMVNRFAGNFISRNGYSQIGAVAGAASADSVRKLREKYQSIFLMLDGYDYPNANAKNCSFAFDKLGHGAIACAGTSITAAWKEEESSGEQYIEQALLAAERMKKNLTRYITIL